MPKENKWDVLELWVAADAADAAEFALGELGALGTYYSIPAQPKYENIMVSGYFESRIPNENVSAALASALEIHGVSVDSVESCEWTSVEERDWLAEWKAHWQPTFTDRFVVAPSWKEVEPDGRLVILIEPGMAFGTGTHETTRLCLKAIEKAFEPGMSFLDVGTGTGILAIAASLVSGGSSRIDGCDTDADAVAIAVENAGLNAADGIAFSVGPIKEDTPSADFVCANLTAGVILPILPLLLEKTGSVLILSGVLAEQEEKVVKELSQLGFPDTEIDSDGEWISLTVRKPS